VTIRFDDEPLSPTPRPGQIWTFSRDPIAVTQGLYLCLADARPEYVTMLPLHDRSLPSGRDSYRLNVRSLAHETAYMVARPAALGWRRLL
jgi:hypothetical protein